MYNFGFYLSLVGFFFAIIIGGLIFSRIRKDTDTEIPFFVGLMLIALTQALYNTPENIRRPFLIGACIFVTTLSVLIAKHYAKKEKRATALKYVAGATIFGGFGVLIALGKN
jgi:hypothetical protein